MAIARCVHARMYEREPYKDRWKMTVDTRCSSGYQIPVGVLHRLRILKPIDPIARRHDFACVPDEFRQRIAEHKQEGCSYDMLVLALICLLELYPNQQDVHAYLVRLGVCRPHDDHTEAKPRPAPNLKIGSTCWEFIPADIKRTFETWPSDRIRWGDKKDHYEELRHHWAELLDSSSYSDPC